MLAKDSTPSAATEETGRPARDTASNLPAGQDIAPHRPGPKSEDGLDVAAIRRDFPALRQVVSDGKPLVYLDSAATSLKPECVVRAVTEYLTDYPANVHRGLHTLSERATEAFEGAREKVAGLLGVEDSGQIVFTRGTTEAINLVAQSWGRSRLKPGDVILLSELEHHSNLVPWQMLAQERGVELRYMPLTDDAEIDANALEASFQGPVRLVAVTGMSNVTGTLPPLETIVALARQHGARVLIDAAQSLPHRGLDVLSLDPDFVAFSGHKFCGPTGVGVLYGKRALLEDMPPATFGGSMVVRVERQKAEWNEIPWKFEAGTPPIAEAIGLGAAIDYLAQFPPGAIAAHEHDLLLHAHETLGEIPGLMIYGPANLEHKGGIVSFTLEGTHPHDLAQLLDRSGIAIRAGHHCAMPLHLRLGISASARASFALYNTRDEVDQLADALKSIRTLLRRRPPAPGTPRPASPAATEPPNG
ncbi:MAG: cysteine desulfurase [Isosphaeraceae bacterium]